MEKFTIRFSGTIDVNANNSEEACAIFEQLKETILSVKAKEQGAAIEKVINCWFMIND